MTLIGFDVEPRDLPDKALLQTYTRADGCYADCYTADVSSSVTLAEFVAAFYTTRLFKLERVILKYAASKPSTDEEAQDVALGQSNRFAAWRVEQRSEQQLLMCDFAGRTRSWFMVDTIEGNTHLGTRLYFGSAVVPVPNKKQGQHSMGLMFGALLGFHKLYSRALLSATRSGLSDPHGHLSNPL